MLGQQSVNTQASRPEQIKLNKLQLETCARRGFFVVCTCQNFTICLSEETVVFLNIHNLWKCLQLQVN